MSEINIKETIFQQHAKELESAKVENKNEFIQIETIRIIY